MNQKISSLRMIMRLISTVNNACLLRIHFDTVIEVLTYLNSTLYPDFSTLLFSNLDTPLYCLYSTIQDLDANNPIPSEYLLSKQVSKYK